MQTMYEILEVAPNASLAELKAAHKRAARSIMSGALDLSYEDRQFKLNILDVALHTLSTPASRDAYDATLASSTAVSVIPNSSSPENEARALQIITAFRENRKIEEADTGVDQPTIKVISHAVSTSAKALKLILRITIGLFILALLLGLLNFKSLSHQGSLHNKATERAEEKFLILEYYKKYGVRPASRAEVEFLERENGRKLNEQSVKEFEERRRQEEYRRFVSESERLADQVHANLERDAMIESMRQRQLAQIAAQNKQLEREAEQMRIENERQRYGLD
jgi:hypothetical protein